MRWRRSIQSEDDAGSRFEAIGIMLMDISRKLDRVIELLEDENGRSEEAEAD